MTTLPIIQNTRSEVTTADVMHACGRARYRAHNFLVKVVKGSGKTQKEIAELCDLDEGALSRILRRPHNYEINTVSKIIHAATGAYLEMSALVPEKAQPKVDAF